MKEIKIKAYEASLKIWKIKNKSKYFVRNGKF